MADQGRGARLLPGAFAITRLDECRTDKRQLAAVGARHGVQWHHGIVDPVAALMRGWRDDRACHGERTAGGATGDGAQRFSR